MQEGHIDILCAETNRFYSRHADSFSASRYAAWPGWQRVMQDFANSRGGWEALRDLRGIEVLDAACGNLRFEKYALEHHADLSWHFHALDACPQLANESFPDGLSASVRYEQIDLMHNADFKANAYDLAVCFAYLHHVPTNELRLQFLKRLCAAAAPGGLVAVSFWCFADDDDLCRKAQESTERGSTELNVRLDEGDYLLGWSGDESVYRYCHSFSREEIDGYVKQLGPHFVPIDIFKADGRNAALNTYLVLQSMEACHSV